MPTPPLSIYYIGGQNGKGPGWSSPDITRALNKVDLSREEKVRSIQPVKCVSFIKVCNMKFERTIT